MKQLIIKFEPFVFKQTVFLKEDDDVQKIDIPQKELTSFISLQENLSAVHFFGNEKFIKKIEEECITKYKLNNVKYYINN